MAGETEVLGGNLPQSHFVHHKSRMIWPGLEPVSSQWETSHAWAMARPLCPYTVRPTRGYPRKMLVYEKNKSTIHLHVIPLMKCGCVLGIRKKEVGNTKR
jgi:hypothetical protein